MGRPSRLPWPSAAKPGGKPENGRPRLMPFGDAPVCRQSRQRDDQGVDPDIGDEHAVQAPRRRAGQQRQQSAHHTGRPWAKPSPKTTADKAIVEPTERSIPAVRMISVIGRASRASSQTCVDSSTCAGAARNGGAEMSGRQQQADQEQQQDGLLPHRDQKPPQGAAWAREAIMACPFVPAAAQMVRQHGGQDKRALNCPLPIGRRLRPTAERSAWAAPSRAAGPPGPSR